MTKIKFGVIGQGHIGKRHAEMIRRNPNCELVAVCDIDAKENLGLSDLKENFYNLTFFPRCNNNRITYLET